MSAPGKQSPVHFLPLERGWKRDRHVIKHLYRLGERWDLIVPGLPADLYQRALNAGCECVGRLLRGSTRRERLPESCKRMVRADHEAYYQPTYQQEAWSAQDRGRMCSLGGDRLFLAGAKGVLIVARQGTGEKPPRVLSAYRPVLGNPERRTTKEFAELAEHLWQTREALAPDPDEADKEET